MLDAVTEWSVTTRLGHADSTVAVALVMYMNHDRYTQYILQIGSGVQVDGRDARGKRNAVMSCRLVRPIVGRIPICPGGHP